jgi:hypothetical protein
LPLIPAPPKTRKKIPKFKKTKTKTKNYVYKSKPRETTAINNSKHQNEPSFKNPDSVQ